MGKIIINRDNKKNRIPAEIHGQFAEHLGHCIYGGIFVGEDSDIPNVRGMRQDVVAALKDLSVPVLRWPGGCFADEYHWKDGIGPRENRPSIVNSNWGGVVEDNSFGTHEFLDFCEQIGAQPYINGNLGSGSVQEMQEWVEYLTCSDLNSPMAKLRAENGREEAWKVEWFGVGNENWGCGGNMCPDYYAQEFKRYQTFVRNYGDNKIKKVACGPNSADYQWTESLMKHAKNQMDYLTLHYYAVDGPWSDKGAALNFDEDAWYRLLAKSWKMKEMIDGHLAIMDRMDPDKRVQLLVDEWGAWYNVEEGTHPGFLYQQNSMRDAMLASMNLDLFQAYSSRIAMANIAQMVNVLQAMILTREEQMVLTPTYHVFHMYKDHQNAMLLDSWSSNPMLELELKERDGRDIDCTLPHISHSASMKDDGKVYVTISNYHHANAEKMHVEVLSEQVASLKVTKARILDSNGVLDAHNDFDAPDTVAPQDFTDIQVDGNCLIFDLPAASILAIEVEVEG